MISNFDVSPALTQSKSKSLLYIFQNAIYFNYANNTENTTNLMLIMGLKFTHHNTFG